MDAIRIVLTVDTARIDSVRKKIEDSHAGHQNMGLDQSGGFFLAEDGWKATAPFRMGSLGNAPPS